MRPHSVADLAKPSPSQHANLSPSCVASLASHGSCVRGNASADRKGRCVRARGWRAQVQCASQHRVCVIGAAAMMNPISCCSDRSGTCSCCESAATQCRPRRRSHHALVSSTGSLQHLIRLPACPPVARTFALLTSVPEPCLSQARLPPDPPAPGPARLPSSLLPPARARHRIASGMVPNSASAAWPSATTASCLAESNTADVAMAKNELFLRPLSVSCLGACAWMPPACHA